MSYISVKEASEKWGITERVVRQYCGYSRETRQKTEAEKSA